MIILAFAQWWYGAGWRDAAGSVSHRLGRVYLSFSVPILLRTMFSPWRRIISSTQGSLDERFRAGIDNLVSRGVGFGVRFIALFTAGAIMLLYLILGGVWLILWPVLPIGAIILLIMGLL